MGEHEPVDAEFVGALARLPVVQERPSAALERTVASCVASSVEELCCTRVREADVHAVGDAAGDLREGGTVDAHDHLHRLHLAQTSDLLGHCSMTVGDEGEERDAHVVDALIVTLKDPDRAVREDATIALGMIGDPRAIDALLEAMKDGVVKRHAIASLGMIGDPRALPAVLDALKGKGIKQEGSPTPGCIVSEDAFIKEAAATALGQFRDPSVIPDLIMLLKDGVLREKAAQALTVIGDTAIEPLIAFLYDPKASEVEAEGERVLSYASVRLTAKDALRLIVLETLETLGWSPPAEEVQISSSKADNLRVDRPLGDTGRFGPSGDVAKSS